MGKLTGRLTEFLGRWTNDRRTEAKGRVEQKAPEAPEVPEQAVEQEKEQVRREHGDVNP
jgi:uncharacterized protein YjbJ (UPF0337 family)